MATTRKIWPISAVLALLLFCSVGTANAVPISVDNLLLTIEIDAGKPQAEGGAGYVSLPWFTVQAEFEGTLDVDWATGNVGIALTEVTNTRTILESSDPLRLGSSPISIGNGISSSSVTTASLAEGGNSATFGLYAQIDMLIEGSTPTVWPLVNKEAIVLEARYEGPDPLQGIEFLTTPSAMVALYNKNYIAYSFVRPFGDVSAVPNPEPGTLLLLGGGLIGIVGIGYRRNRRG